CLLATQILFSSSSMIELEKTNMKGRACGGRRAVKILATEVCGERSKTLLEKEFQFSHVEQTQDQNEDGAEDGPLKNEA
ncbi:unnamed protein product, partial [Amoebophrya sp. A25]